MTRRDLVSGLDLLFAHVGQAHLHDVCTVVKWCRRFPVGTGKSQTVRSAGRRSGQGPHVNGFDPTERSIRVGGARSSVSSAGPVSSRSGTWTVPVRTSRTCYRTVSRAARASPVLYNALARSSPGGRNECSSCARVCSQRNGCRQSAMANRQRRPRRSAPRRVGWFLFARRLSDRCANWLERC